MTERMKQAADTAYRKGVEEGRRGMWLEMVRAVAALAGELHADDEAQRVLHLVQERFAALSVKEDLGDPVG